MGLLLGGCDSAAPTPAPRTLVPATPSPAPTLTPTAAPTVNPTPQPTIDCATAGGGASLDLDIPVGAESIDLQEGPLESPVAVDPSDVPIVSTVVGGIELTADLAVGGGLDTSTQISAISADFLPFGSASTLPVAATVVGSAVSLRLPDKRLDGQLRVELSWTTECGTGGGGGAIGLTVVPSSVAAGCPTTADDLADALAPLKNAQLTIGALNEPLRVLAWSGRWILGNGATDVPQFAGWDDAHAVVAAPETKVVVRESIADLSMVSMQLARYRRADVVAYLAGGSTGVLETDSYNRTTPGPLGRTSITAPLDPGRYVVDMTGSWLTSCLSVETNTAVSLDVR